MENYIALLDIGGTYTKLKILDFKKKGFKIFLKKKEKIREKKKLLKFFRENLRNIRNLNHLILCIAGPVFKDSGYMTNWEKKPSINSKELKKLLKVKKIYLLNDLEAQGWGLLYLKNKGFLNKKAIQISGPSIKNNGENMALVVPGTGLGTCAVIKNNIVVPMELQHSTFYPNNNMLINVFKSFLERKIFPSYENFVSGEGLLNIYKSLKNLEKNFCVKDPGNFVRLKAKKGEKEGIESIKLYFFALALYCQALALALKPFGGIFLGGKAIKRNLEFFPEKKFKEIFLKNPKQEKLLKKIPLYFIKEDLIFEGLLNFYRFNEKI